MNYVFDLPKLIFVLVIALLIAVFLLGLLLGLFRASQTLGAEVDDLVDRVEDLEDLPGRGHGEIRAYDPVSKYDLRREPVPGQCRQCQAQAFIREDGLCVNCRHLPPAPAVGPAPAGPGEVKA